MPYSFYKILHLSSLAFSLVTLAAMCFYVAQGGQHIDNPKKKLLSIVHGIGLIVVLVSGFGLLARLGIHDWPVWVVLKLVIWLLLGAYPVLVKKCSQWGTALLFSLAAVFSLAAYLAVLKPF